MCYGLKRRKKNELSVLNQARLRIHAFIIAVTAEIKVVAAIAK
jgi:hypothetical protein